MDLPSSVQPVMAEDRAKIQTDIIRESTGLMYDIHLISKVWCQWQNGALQGRREEDKTQETWPRVTAQSYLFDYLISTLYNHQDSVQAFLGLRLGMTQRLEVTNELGTPEAGKRGRGGERRRGRGRGRGEKRDICDTQVFCTLRRTKVTQVGADEPT